MNDSYRFDRRTKEQFKKDVKEGTRLENELIKRWIAHVFKKTGKKVEAVRSSDVGANGEFLEFKNVKMTADFVVKDIGPVEVKFSKPLLDKKFHLKAGQVRSYVKQNASVMMFNGVETDKVQFTIISPESLKKIARNNMCVSWVGFGFKDAYRILIKDVEWETLDD